MPSWWSDPNPKHAFTLSWISVILTAGAAAAGLIYFVSTGSALCLVFGLENIVDFLSSVVVLWRFYCPGKLTSEREDLLRKRETRASMAISFVLVLLGISVLAAALDDLSKGEETEKEMNVVIALALIGIFIFGTLTIIKFHYAQKFDSSSLQEDGICSLIGAVLASGLFATTLIIERVPSLWWVDPVFAMLCGVAALGLGGKSIFIAKFVDNTPIFTLQWWLLSQGGGIDESDTETEGGTKVVEMTENEDSTKLSEVV